MIVRAIVGTLVFIFFIIPFINRVRRERNENKRVSKWSIFFIVFAALIWILLMLSVIIQMT
ncbi:hypothetical protein [Salinicoccus sp. YB14-2]|uniref:hypothetical protein n=1 Tax=Salinicoccus sp. YB14-2 TaxID=1572701 RepID=UPI000690C315|nr:hypothetical protein [Salinicoccus sp. YB14-2]